MEMKVPGKLSCNAQPDPWDQARRTNLSTTQDEAWCKAVFFFFFFFLACVLMNEKFEPWDFPLLQSIPVGSLLSVCLSNNQNQERKRKVNDVPGCWRRRRVKACFHWSSAHSSQHHKTANAPNVALFQLYKPAKGEKATKLCVTISWHGHFCFQETGKVFLFWSDGRKRQWPRMSPALPKKLNTRSMEIYVREKNNNNKKSPSTSLKTEIKK